MNDRIKAVQMYYSLYDAQHNPKTFTQMVEKIPANFLPAVMLAAVQSHHAANEISQQNNREARRLRRKVRKLDGTNR